MAFIDSTMTTVCVRSREHGQRARYANSGCLQAAHSTKLTQMATTCHLNLFTTIYCYSIVFFGFGASFTDPQFVVLSIGSIYGAWPCVCVCVCLIFILFVWREQERDSMAILCDLWGESEENWTKHKSWLHSISFHNILTPSLSVILMFHVIFLLFVLRLLLSNRIIFLSDCAYVSAKVLQLNKLLPYF